MPDVQPSQLMNSVLGKLYDVLANGDDTVPRSDDNFLSWASPGMPIAKEELEFLTQGLTGVVKKRAIDEMQPTPPVQSDGTTPPNGQPVQLTGAELEALRGQDTARLYMQAENFARLIDFVPDVAVSNNNQFARLAILNNEGGLADIYRYTLRMSQVAENELPAATKAKIEKFRKLLSVTKMKKDLLTDEETEVTQASPMVVAYNEKLAAYESAALAYNSVRINALTGSDSKAVHEWSQNANILRNRVRAAMSDWVSSGYKNEYEQIAAFIDQVSQRDMALLKQEYRDDLEKARLTGLASGSDFYFSSLVPAGFATTGGWTRFRFASGDFQRYSSSSHNSKQWSASGSGGFMGIGASASHSSSSARRNFDASFNSDSFGLSFEICNIPLVRDWFKRAFLSSRSWRFDQGNVEAKGEMISDGAKPPKGLIPAYPTSLLFVRNLRLELSHTEGLQSFMSQYSSSSTSAGASVAFGPFNIGGSYSRADENGSSQAHHGFKFDNQGISIDGMQIIGFKCHVMPKCPNPLPEIKNWV
jgi:hypothetical protein